VVVPVLETHAVKPFVSRGEKSVDSSLCHGWLFETFSDDCVELLSPLIYVVDLTTHDEEDDPTKCTDVDEETGFSRSTCVQCG